MIKYKHNDTADVELKEMESILTTTLATLPSGVCFKATIYDSNFKFTDSRTTLEECTLSVHGIEEHVADVITELKSKLGDLLGWITAGTHSNPNMCHLTVATMDGTEDNILASLKFIEANHDSLLARLVAIPPLSPAEQTNVAYRMQDVMSQKITEFECYVRIYVQDIRNKVAISCGYIPRTCIALNKTTTNIMVLSPSIQEATRKLMLDLVAGGYVAIIHVLEGQQHYRVTVDPVQGYSRKTVANLDYLNVLDAQIKTYAR